MKSIAFFTQHRTSFCFVLFIAFSIPATSMRALAIPSACEQLFLNHGSHEIEEPVLIRLERAIQQQAKQDIDFSSAHKLNIKNGKVTFKVGFLSAQHPETLKALGRAVGEGKIHKIEMGTIVGPKVLRWMLRTIRQIPKNHRMEITGIFDMPTILENREMDISITDSGEESVERTGWDAKDERDFQNAVKQLGIRHAGDDVYGSTRLSDIGGLSFRFDSSANPAFTWSYFDTKERIGQ